MKIYITARAQSLNTAHLHLSSHTGEVVEHLCKILLMPNSQDRNHWEGEIAGQIHSVLILKNTKKFPSAKQIYKWTYGEIQDVVTDVTWISTMIEDICSDYQIELQESIVNIMKNLDAVCIGYFMWLSEQLSEFGRISNTKIYQKLDELI